MRLAKLKSILFLSGTSWLLFAEPVTGASTMTVKVAVFAPPCVLNDNKAIEVNFGDEVMTTRIDGSNYRTSLEYSFTCSHPQKNSMRLLVGGTSFGIDNNLLRTSVNGLGIAFLKDSSRIALNSWQNFTYPKLSRLEAVLVKQTDVTLITGVFTASATLRVDYQ